jgi:hypothetical protein
VTPGATGAAGAPTGGERWSGAAIAGLVAAGGGLFTLGSDAPAGQLGGAGRVASPPAGPEHAAPAERPAMAAELARPPAGASRPEPPAPSPRPAAAIPATALSEPDVADRRWSCALGVLQQELPRQTFATWVRGARWGGLADGVATIVAARPDLADGLRRLAPQLERVLVSELCQPVRVVITPDAGMPGEPRASLPAGLVTLPARPAVPSARPATPPGPRETPCPAPPGGAPPALAAPAAPVEAPGCPAWISPAAWTALPPTLRVALAGARLEAGQVVASSGFFQSVVARHAEQVRELIGDAGGAA